MNSYSALQCQNNLTYDCWRLRPQTPGGYAARMKLGSSPPEPGRLRHKCEAGGSAPGHPLGLCPKPRWGLRPRPPVGLRPKTLWGPRPSPLLNVVWGGTPMGSEAEPQRGQSLQLDSCGEAAGGLGADPQEHCKLSCFGTAGQYN